ncbi:porin family protein [Snuella sedimenti]|uniref:PorT family protein n=1 Tax=Snuella sedimenti TaxID=2798802 RepID=A0A8J7LPT6_9FLAO|nr:porin family protein [Snuella sedimenti]MBJ6369808.1 PorT family protein [Snuella sedimenti]
MINKNKQLFKTVIFFLCMASCFAQNKIRYGAKAGMNLYGFDKTYFAFGEGLLAGGFIILETQNNKLDYRADISYNQKGGAVSYWTNSVQTQISTKLDYIDIPILIEYEFINNLSLIGGVQVGFLINATSKNSRTGFEIKSTEGFNTLDFSTAAGLKYDLLKRFFIEAKLSYGLTKVLKDYEEKNFPISFSLNYIIN